MPEYEITKTFTNKGTRNTIRMNVVNEFAKEECGAGRDEFASRYKYYVESLADGRRIYLRRPANLHNGFDFIVCVESTDFSEPGKRKRNYPKHKDIIKDLNCKKAEDLKEYGKLYQLLKSVYECNDVVLEEIEQVVHRSGLSPELIVKTVKWLFIEQDIRYWNYSGRDMFWSGIPKP